MRFPALLVVLLLVVAFFTGCAKQVSQTEFKPLQLHWVVAEGQSDENMANKDNCVIRLTGRLMGEAPVQASSAEELEYRVVYGQSPENPSTLVFSGKCENLANAPGQAKECRWTATCDSDLGIVVKFHNGD